MITTMGEKKKKDANRVRFHVSSSAVEMIRGREESQLLKDEDSMALDKC